MFMDAVHFHVRQDGKTVNKMNQETDGSLYRKIILQKNDKALERKI